MSSRTFRLGIKRAFDASAAVAGLVLVSPLMLFCAMGIYLTMGRPIFFRQQRPGHRAKPFMLVKFRTMRIEADSEGKPLPDAARLTGFGKFLRSTSLDELPQLWNVFSGHMSLVGPRPLLMQYLPRYSERQARRHLMPPGITGWAQVHGRNAIGWEAKFEHDVYYVENWSLRLDALILMKTVSRVLFRQGVAQEGHATMPEFLGNEKKLEGHKEVP